MRVLFVIHQYFPHWIGGTEMVVRRLASRLVAAGHDARVVTYHESASNRPEDYGVRLTEFDGVPVHEIHYNLSCHPEPSRAEYDNQITAQFFADVVNEIRPDVAHIAHAMKLSGAIFGVLRDRHVPVVTTLSDYWFLCMRHTLLRPGDVLCSGPDHRYRCLRCSGVTHGFAMPQSVTTRDPWLWLLGAFSELTDRRQRAEAFSRDVRNVARRRKRLLGMLLQSDRILAFSPFLLDMYVRNGVPRNRLTLMRHSLSGSDEAWARAQRMQRARRSPLRIVTIGPLTSFKGAHILVEALRRLPALECELMVYGGPGPDAVYVERLQRAAKEDSRVRLMGQFPPDQLKHILVDASILAHPAIWYENEPIVVKAALSAGVPVWASDIGSLPELVAPVDGCRLLPAGDALAWADCLATLTEDPPPLTVDPPDLMNFDEFFDGMMGVYRELAGT